ncbi:MAG TPA: DUF1003 domain-containing protein [Terricaulis sp.]|nr:DUF1003 domain-containing protein [Terricaulis sp.]
MGKDVLEMLDQLRVKARARRTHPQSEPPSFGARAADAVAASVGSWRFILVQSTLSGAWLLYNALSGKPFDPFPFILLNLLLSFQAAYTAPVIMMSQNRQADIDRQRGIDDFEINKKAELEIETLHHKIDLLREQELAALSAAVERLTRLLEERR